ncbi:MBL fold metallo-hydrolase [Streptomyces mirabilis]|uniref:MBL fold metallo-hydrolase n=1 Tax=Streptomyces mirabilis TaxID=68239 RepID=UPI00225761F3|nr:MBL fold metallo-hydrolase [Streptomyces mirabilis]MCX4432138.1 MBL fold metallo-hydrolase [Streptomyces mirabilis]
MASLHFSTLVQDGVPRAGDQRMPHGNRLVSSPLTTTLILGEREAALVDPPLTREQTRTVADWVERSGKRLTHIYATHGHGDHWFGTAELIRRFPTARAWALPGAIEMMHRQATNGRAEMWDRVFPGLIGDTPVLAAPVPETGLLLEGHELRAVETGHTDTDDSSVLHVPSIGLVVAGDVVYNNVHLYLCEGVLGGFTAWLRALDIVEDLEPDSVVAGHQDRTRPDTPDTIAQTRAYLHDVEDLLTGEPTPPRVLRREDPAPLGPPQPRTAVVRSPWLCSAEPGPSARPTIWHPHRSDTAPRRARPAFTAHSGRGPDHRE